MPLGIPAHHWITLTDRNVIAAASATLSYAIGRYVWDVWPAAEAQCEAAYRKARETGAAAWITFYAGEYSVNQAFLLEDSGLRCEAVPVEFDELVDNLDGLATARAARAGEVPAYAA